MAHLHFDPPPTPGSSGGPIIDEESGSVIGVILGTQLVNQVEGVRGWGVPAEMIYEVRSMLNSGMCADWCFCADVQPAGLETKEQGLALVVDALIASGYYLDSHSLH